MAMANFLVPPAALHASANVLDAESRASAVRLGSRNWRARPVIRAATSAVVVSA
jgi:hypothetical protein